MRKILIIIVALFAMSSCGSVDPCTCINDAKALAIKIQNTTDMMEQTKLAAEAVALEQKCSELAEKDANAWQEALINCK